LWECRMEGSRRSTPEEKTVEGWNKGVLEGGRV
jgi:hypothetical protein